MPTRHLLSSSSLLVLLGSLATGCHGAPSGAPAAAPPADSPRGAETGSVRGLEGEPTGAGGAPGASSPQGCGTDSPMLKYVGQSHDECARIRFVCDPGWSYFSDDCGCGCTKQ